MSNRSSYHVVLLVDHRERNNAQDHPTRQEIVDAVNAAFAPGVHCEVYNGLPAGDYLWVARHPGQPDLVLNCLIERKTWTDLFRCIKEPQKTIPEVQKIEYQMRNVVNTGIGNLLFLLEERRNDSRNLPEHSPERQAVETFSSQMEAGVYNGFSALIKTDYKSMTTIAFLIQQHDNMRRELPFLEFNGRRVSLDELHQKVERAKRCPTFDYYRSLRRIGGVGHTKAMAVLNKFPTAGILQRHCRSHSAVSLKDLRTDKNIRIGLSTAQSIYGAFEGGRTWESDACQECVQCLPHQLKRRNETLQVVEQHRRQVQRFQQGGSDDRHYQMLRQQPSRDLVNRGFQHGLADPARAAHQNAADMRVHDRHYHMLRQQQPAGSLVDTDFQHSLANPAPVAQLNAADPSVHEAIALFHKIDREGPEAIPRHIVQEQEDILKQAHKKARLDKSLNTRFQEQVLHRKGNVIDLTGDSDVE